MAGSRADENESSIRLNLSYVLHERSDSRIVRRQARACRRFQRKHTALLNSFMRLPDDDLASAIVVSNSFAASHSGNPGVDRVLTVSAGLPDLLPRALSVTGTVGPEPSDERFIALDQGFTAAGCTYVQLFRGIAALPRIAASDSILVAALLVRPGEASLMLTGQRFELSQTQRNSNPVELPRIRSLLESIIRDHVDQWTPERALWDGPAESTLPEFQSQSMARQVR